MQDYCYRQQKMRIHKRNSWVNSSDVGEDAINMFRGRTTVNELCHFHVMHFHVLQFHALLLGPSFSRPAFSAPRAFWYFLIVM